ncbi:Lysozyme [Duffyella gerundensis]|jgi:lysozyme|uniref:Lysozyme n=2 Tax=Duffyella gerundensis TaxID=1619313 RepID=A0A0U5L1X9_9GAMM|nr:Lysozyme [Duffyella gerundensis]
MAMSNSLRNKLMTAAGSGAMFIAMAFLGGKEGVEGRQYTPYQDVAGVWTVCDGHTGSDIVQSKQYTDRECNQLLSVDLQPVKKTVDSMVKIPLGEYQRAALYSFTYNVGTRAFSTSTLLKQLNAGDVKGACQALRHWVYAGGQKWRGLMNRRDMERSMCLAENADDLAGK